MLISKHNITLFNDTQLHNMNELNINQSKPLIYQGLERVVMAVNGIRKHFIQCRFWSLRTQICGWIQAASTYHWFYSLWPGGLLAMMEDHWKVVFFHFPLLIARQFINPFVEELTAFTVNPHLIQISLFPPRFSVFDHIRSSQTVLSFVVL